MNLEFFYIICYKVQYGVSICIRCLCVICFEVLEDQYLLQTTYLMYRWRILCLNTNWKLWLLLQILQYCAKQIGCSNNYRQSEKSLLHMSCNNIIINDISLGTKTNKSMCLQSLTSDVVAENCLGLQFTVQMSLTVLIFFRFIND